VLHLSAHFSGDPFPGGTCGHNLTYDAGADNRYAPNVSAGDHAFDSAQRPRCEVRTAAPGDTERELATFRPHLLVRNDNDGLAAEVLAGVPWRVEMQYTDSIVS
jgi:hypothetical protein